MFQHQHEDTKELCHTLRRHMDVFLRSKTFRCERLPGEAPAEVHKFCSSAGLITITKCLTENKGVTEASECLLKSIESYSISTPLSWCFCQSMFDSFLSLFSTTQLLCAETFLDNVIREGKLFAADGNGGFTFGELVKDLGFTPATTAAPTTTTATTTAASTTTTAPTTTAASTTTAAASR
jgi:hypothetical protein